MRTRLPPILWILIIVLATQGAMPGVVVCVETTGQVKIENIQDRCCDGGMKTFGQTVLFVLTASPGSEPAGSCGPCTDTLISPIPVTKPARDGDVSVGPLPGTVLVPGLPAIRAEAFSVSPSVTTAAALILIKTTTLLI